MQLEKFTRTELAFKGKNRKGKLGVWGRTLWWWGKQNYLSQATWQKLTNVQMLGTLKIKLDKAIVRDNRLQQQEGRFKLFSSSSPWSWLLSWLFLSRKLKVFTDSRELCLYLLPALAILGQFAWQIYEQEQNMRTETAFELYAKSRNNKQKTKFWNKECVREKIKSTSFTLSCKRDVSSIFFGARLNEAIYYRRRWKKSCTLVAIKSQGWAVMGSATDSLQNPVTSSAFSRATLIIWQWMGLFAKFSLSYASCSNPSEDKLLPSGLKISHVQKQGLCWSVVSKIKAYCSENLM